ncbi:hypothetical protein FLAG1_01276 [Fusarium langsethiae]|uniref:Uncharacterized protein n=1 Tax=Fusarium langsethiae TaxID=179993 RepID=A0A0M9F4A1_FUSLA|nr:hypothetical protein FLAG1_01276 [Fusarium langsethiae]GKT98515.1 unnamed protein product [Fusarium langsethiae]GKU18335.1 unnamed protein product [Fusarium langsethiae]
MHVNHGSGPEHLTSLSGIKDTPAQQSNALTQGSKTRINSTSTNEFLATQETQMDSFLQHSGEKPEEQRSTQTKLSNPLAAIADWLKHLAAASRGAHICEELELARKYVVDVEGQYQQLEMDQHTLQKQLQEAHTELAKVVKERDELRKLVDVANWTGAVKTSDDAIRSKWKQLDYNIRAMARALAKCQTRRPTDNASKALFESIISSWPELLENDDYKELLITAYLWALVNGQIFQNGNKLWGGGLICGLKRARARLVELAPEADRPSRSGPTMRHVAKWSAQGTALLSHFYGRDEKAPKRRAAHALGRLKQFCNIAAEKARTDFLQEMKGIIEVALDVDEMLMSSMAILTIQWPETGQSKRLRYDEDGMDAVAHINDLSPRTAVAFTISPMLLKMGNSNGCNYDSEMVLCKASVVFQGPVQHQVLEWSGRDDICTGSGQLDCNGGILYTMYM